MPLPIHDKVGSAVNLAKSWLMGLDKSKADTSLPTATLELFLTMLIDLGTPAHAMVADETANKTVMGHMAMLNETIRSENDASEARAGKAY